MKIRPLFLIVAVMLAVAAGAYAQTVIVTPKKTTYRRRKPISPMKKTFVVVWPKVRAASPAVSRKIEAALSYEKNFEFTLADELNDIQWLEEATYEVKYNDNGLLAVELTISGSAAYPDGSTRYVVVDSKSGNVVRPVDVFSNLAGLAARVKKMQAAEVRDAVRDMKKDPDSREYADSAFAETDFKVENLRTFGVSAKGVTFYYDYGFPHVAQALEPAGEFFLSWSQIKPYVKPTGLLGRMVR